MSDCEKIIEDVNERHEFLMDDRIDLTITEIVMKKYGRIWKKHYRTNEMICIFHHAGSVEIEKSYFRRIERSVMDKIDKCNCEGKPINIRRIVKRVIRYEAS